MEQQLLNALGWIVGLLAIGVTVWILGTVQDAVQAPLDQAWGDWPNVPKADPPAAD